MDGAVLLSLLLRSVLFRGSVTGFLSTALIRLSRRVSVFVVNETRKRLTSIQRPISGLKREVRGERI